MTFTTRIKSYILDNPPRFLSTTMEAEEREAGNEVVKLPVVFTSLTSNKLKLKRVEASLFPPVVLSEGTS